MTDLGIQMFSEKASPAASPAKISAPRQGAGWNCSQLGGESRGRPLWRARFFFARGNLAGA
eukprot:9468276-Pyramimonas_sp.AAC.1